MKEILFMPAKAAAVTVVASEVRDLLIKHLATGASTTTIAAKMQHAGHKGWNSTVVNAVASKGRLLTIDEAVGLLGVFKASAQIILRDIDRIAALIGSEVRGGRP